MATLYVSSVDGNDSDDGSTWALAKATVTGALASATDATNIIYVDSAHAHTAASSTMITWDTSANTNVAIISVNRGTGAYEAGATETAGSNAAFRVIHGNASALFIRGMTMQTDTSTGTPTDLRIADTNVVEAGILCFVDCVLSNRSGALNTIILGGEGQTAERTTLIVLENTQLVLCNATAGSSAPISVQNATIKARNITIGFSGANKPPKLFDFNNAYSTTMEIIDSDLSGYNTSGGVLFTVDGLRQSVILRNTKFSATPSFVSGTFGYVGSITVINCDSSDTRRVFEYYDAFGTLLESESIYADDGAAFDGAGVSWHVVTTAACSEYTPFITPWMSRWNGNTVSTNFDIELVWDSATDFTDREVWGEIEYVSSSSYPLGTLASTRNAEPFFGSAADLTNSAENWTGTGGFSNANPQRVRVTATPGEKSVARGRLCIGKASTTLYVDPALRIATA